MKWILALPLAASLLTAQTPARPRILGVAHIAVFAKDLEKSRAFYHDFLGFEEPYTLTKADGSPSMLFFKVNERQYIELSPEGMPGGGRLNHISIETDNAEAMRQYLASRGVKVPAKVGKGRIGNSNFNIRDPEGHTVEIVQYEPEGWTVREKGKHVPESRISTRIAHVGIIVTQFDAEMKFYQDVLGFQETWRGSRSETELQWVNLRVPDGQDYIELMLYKDAPAAALRGTAHHLSLEVPDAARSVAALEAKPSRKDYTRTIEIRTGINRKRQVNLYDPDGTRSELMEPDTVDGKPAPSSKAPPPGAQALGIFEGHGDVGTVLHAGSAEYDESRGTYTVTGSGENMWFAADAFQFVWKKVSGDVSISADVAFNGTGGDAHRKAILMIRQSLDADSAYADAARHGDGLTSLQSREEKGAVTKEIQSKVSAPKRLRLVKQGEYAYMMVDGALSGGWLRVPITGAYYVGIGVCAHNKDRVEQAVFSNVELTEPVLYSTIETVKVASTDRRTAYVSKGRIQSPSWSRDGSALIFNRDGKTYRVPFEGDQAEPGTESDRFGGSLAETPDLGAVAADFNNWFPHVSPDGKKVVFVSYPKDMAGNSAGPRSDHPDADAGRWQGQGSGPSSSAAAAAWMCHPGRRTAPG